MRFFLCCFSFNWLAGLSVASRHWLAATDNPQIQLGSFDSSSVPGLPAELQMRQNNGASLPCCAAGPSCTVAMNSESQKVGVRNRGVQVISQLPDDFFFFFPMKLQNYHV